MHGDLKLTTRTRLSEERFGMASRASGMFQSLCIINTPDKDLDSNSPYGERRIGTIVALKARAPVLGGNFGVWGGLFSSFDCAVRGIRCEHSCMHICEPQA
jgi:hypothetical protein